MAAPKLHTRVSIPFTRFSAAETAALKLHGLPPKNFLKD